MNPDGSGLKKLTTRDPGKPCYVWYHDQLTWSPDGTKLAFVSGGIGTGASAVSAPYNSSTQSPCDDGRVNIYVMNADGSDRKRLTDDRGDYFHPVWSPDGTEIVFVSGTAYTLAAYIMKADGSNVRKFVLDPGETIQPVWSRDGSKIAFVRNQNGVWIMDADGRNQHRVTDGAQVAWSPDGTKLVFTKSTGGFSAGVFLVNTDGSNETLLTDNMARNTSPAWQPVLFNSSPPTLTSNQVTIITWTLLGRTFAYVKLTLPDAGFWLAAPGSPVRTGSDVSADARVEHFIDPTVQSVTTTAQIYDLGPLPDGNYTFTFKNAGAVVKTQSFNVSSVQSPPNPIDDAREFVRQHYRDFLNRESDQAGEAFWTDNITRCSDPARRPAGLTEAQCTVRQRETTSAAFFLSPEFQYTGYYVYRMYQGALGRKPKLSEFRSDAQFVSAGILVNSQLSAPKINQNKADFAQQFVNCTDATRYRCSEFKATYDGLNNQQYVDKLFLTTGVNASASDRAILVNGLNAIPATETRASVLQKVVDGIFVISEGNQQFTTSYGQSFYNSEFNRAFVVLEYFSYMKRDPDDTGYAFWLGKLNQFGGNFVNAEMVLAFISSPEYRARFGQP